MRGNGEREKKERTYSLFGELARTLVFAVAK